MGDIIELRQEYIKRDWWDEYCYIYRGAYKWWAESLDHTLRTTDALHTWREMMKDSTDISSDLLKKCGLWGCLLGGVLASNIAQ